ncbi:hypothetical protein XF35_39490 [Streptomyces platensis subsp. clarensis]|uniref:Uncharacterized protein n=1 Tax=Streptomyces showdoensis TaxID=68268 RepID=A0A2P2GGG0_STREW|nr:hypothetical protein [Streptomyces showdoensis]KKZ69885.1 hypothetical protein VO63_31895 [Streptomyces showdoensis]MCW7991137.1 hypothetical protein [Streptomyces platensis subsp. clarensis]
MKPIALPKSSTRSRWTLVRVGTRRTSLHTDLQCPMLHSRPETCDEVEFRSEDEALADGLTQCGTCAH